MGNALAIRRDFISGARLAVGLAAATCSHGRPISHLLLVADCAREQQQVASIGLRRPLVGDD